MPRFNLSIYETQNLLVLFEVMKFGDEVMVARLMAGSILATLRGPSRQLDSVVESVTDSGISLPSFGKFWMVGHSHETNGNFAEQNSMEEELLHDELRQPNHSSEESQNPRASAVIDFDELEDIANGIKF